MQPCITATESISDVILHVARNNRIASCCNYRSENFQYRPTLDKTKRPPINAYKRLMS